MGKSKFSYKKVIVIKLNRFEVVSGKYIEEIQVNLVSDIQ